MSNSNIKVNSDDEDEGNKMGLSRSGDDRLDLLQYNKHRKDQLYDFDYTMDQTKDEEEENFDEQVMMANKLKLNCFNNLEISLFWEEKFVMLIRVAQLYSCIFFFYFE